MLVSWVLVCSLVLAGDVLVLQPELSIGGNPDNDEYFWSGLHLSLSVDSRGHCFVSDPEQNRVLEYNGAGRMVGRLGGAGTGPGEWGQLLSFHKLANDRGLSIDYQGGQVRLQYYDARGEFVKLVRPEGPSPLPMWVLPAPDGKLLVTHTRRFDSKAGQIHHAWVLCDPRFQTQHQLAAYSGSMASADPELLLSREGAAQVLVALLGQYAAPRGLACFDSKGVLYTAVSDSYRITQWTADRKQPQRVISRKLKAQPLSHAARATITSYLAEQHQEGLPASYRNRFSTKMLDEAWQLAGLSATGPILLGLVAMEDGGLLAIRELDLQSGMGRADLFSPQGRFLGQMRLGNFALLSPGFQPRLVFRAGKAYGLETNPRGDNLLVRYRLEARP